MHENIHHYLDRAISLGNNAYTSGDFPIGSVLIIDGEIEIEGQNKVVTENDRLWHSEIDILKKSAAYKGNGYNKILFVTLEPCNNCAKALVEYGIDEVHYILEDPAWGGREIMEQAGIKTHQVNYRYSEYLDTMIEFMTKHGNYNEALNQYISIKENGRNIYREQLEKTIAEDFINIPPNLADYEARKIVYNNTLSYLRNALYRTPEDKHHLVFSGYRSDTERVINYCQKFIEDPSSDLTEELIRGLHENLYPAGYIQKSKTPDGQEFIWMIPGQYREIDIVSNDNTDKNIYLRPSEMRTGLTKILGEYNERGKASLEGILYFLADFFIVHPFGDGNGRVAYILTDLLLLKNGLEPLYLGRKKENDKVGFYKILDDVYETRNLESFFGFLQKYPQLSILA